VAFSDGGSARRICCGTVAVVPEFTSGTGAFSVGRVEEEGEAEAFWFCTGNARAASMRKLAERWDTMHLRVRGNL
jgi:hypothetical protein